MNQAMTSVRPAFLPSFFEPTREQSSSIASTRVTVGERERVENFGCLRAWVLTWFLLALTW